jgi:hypothetical protein
MAEWRWTSLIYLRGICRGVQRPAAAAQPVAKDVETGRGMADIMSDSGDPAMTVAERKQKLQKRIARLNARQLAKVEDVAYAIDPDEASLSADEKRKIARMKRKFAKAMEDYAAGRTRNWREIRSDV